MIADQGRLDSDEAREFFNKHEDWLTLTTAYNPEANKKIKRGHGPIVKALVKACDRDEKSWPQLLPYILWVDQTTCSAILLLDMNIGWSGYKVPYSSMS